MTFVRYFGEFQHWTIEGNLEQLLEQHQNAEIK